MKKGKLLGIFILFSLIFFLGFGSSLTAQEDTEIFNKAKNCLIDVVENASCDSIPLEDRIFAYLGVSKCKEEIISEAQGSNECWPNGACDLRTTALATLALAHSGEDTNSSEEWLLEQKKIATNIEWYLEVDTKNASTCSIAYDTFSYSATTLENKKVSISPSMCLSTSSNGYWFRVSPLCYDKEFEITCDEDFVSTLLFKKASSSTVHVLDEVHSSSAQGSTIEKINSYCFANSAGVCNYEGTLWAASVLNYLGHNVSNYLPYLIVNIDDSPRLIPQSFLYILTGNLEYKTYILSKQINKQYWKMSEDKFYDTALALLPFQGESTLQEKAYSKDWLKSIQDEEGCWDNKNIANNGFLIYSLWGEFNKASAPTGNVYCSDVNYFCVYSSDCEGNIISQYECSGFSKVCCDSAPVLTTCEGEGGVKCNSNEYCDSPGEKRVTDDLTYGQSCCMGGTCEEIEIPEEENECVDIADGRCESSVCAGGWKETSIYECADSGDICCVQEETNYWWIWVLLALIVVVALIIVFKDKIKELIWKSKSKGGPSPGIPPRGPPPSYPRNPQMNLPSRRIITPQQRIPPRRVMPQRKSPKELDDVLSKLKNMSQE